VVKQGYADLQNRQSARAHDVARMATPDRVGMPPCRHTRSPRQACSCWVEHRVLVTVHDACGSPGWCHVLLAHWPRRAAHALSLADGRTRVAARPPYYGHAAAHTWSSLNLVPKLTPQQPRAGHISPPSPRA
jgi:hypothetical protein